MLHMNRYLLLTAPSIIWWGLFVVEESKKFSIKEILIMGGTSQEWELETAFSYYKVILDKLPGHPDANHNLGLLAIDMGAQRSSLLIEDAINSNPNVSNIDKSAVSL